MRRPFLTTLLFCIASLLVSGAFAEDQKPPVVMVFEITRGDGASVDMGIEATQAVKYYLRKTGRADVVSFDPESPLIRRAVKEGRLKPEQYTKLDSLEEQIAVARVLDVEQVVTGVVSFKDERALVQVMMAQVNGKGRWKREGTAFASGPNVNVNDNSVSNAIQSAASKAVTDLAFDALKDVIPIPEQTEQDAAIKPQTPPEDPSSFAQKGNQCMAAGDVAGAITAYRRAVNAEPNNIDYRIRLAKAYAKRGMTEQAADELKRALVISPSNEDAKLALAKIYEEKGIPEKAEEVYVKQTQEDPQNVESWLNAGDLYWRQQKLDEAEQQYVKAVELDPYDARPRERLLLLFAARGMFSEGKRQAEHLQKLYANAGDAALLDRYEKLKPIIDTQLNSLLGKLQDNNKKFNEKKMTREELYNIVKGVSLRLDSMSRFLEVIIVPADKKPEMQRRILATNLLSQAGYSLISYLETNTEYAKTDADTFMTEAANLLKDSAKK